MIVTIDGPAGAGKSSVAKALAIRLGFRFLDTGAMYRAVTIAGIRRNIDWDRGDELAELARGIAIQFQGDRVYLDGEDITNEIRTSAVTELIHFAAGNPAVRRRLVELQRRVAEGGSIVTEGRDQGTVVFPQAECKVFLTASPSERARRRFLEIQARGDQTPFEEVLRQQNQRDARDEVRDIAPLVPAPDAVQVDTDGLSPEAVVDQLEKLVRSRRR